MIVALFVARRRKKLALTSSVTSLRFAARRDDDHNDESHGSDVDSYGSADDDPDRPPPAAVGNYVDSINLDRYVMHSEDVRVGETYVNPLRVNVLRVDAAPTYFARAVVNSGDGAETRALGQASPPSGGIRTANAHRLGAARDDEPIYSRASAYPTVNVPDSEREFALDEEDDEPLYECASSLSARSSSRDIYSMVTSASALLSSALPLSTDGREQGRTIDGNEPNYAWASPNPDEDIYDNIYEMATREGLMAQPIYSRARGNSFKHNR